VQKTAPLAFCTPPDQPGTVSGQWRIRIRCQKQKAENQQREPDTETVMKQTEQERRRFERLFFSAEENISGIFRLPEPYRQQALGSIMDINQEGIGITFPKDECPQLVTGDSLFLIKIMDERFFFMENIGMKIMWVLNHRSLDHMAMGCEFTQTSSDLRKRISEILKKWPHTGQDERAGSHFSVKTGQGQSK